MKHRLTRIGNRIGVWMYRTLNGRLSSGSKRVHVLLITTPGRRTGVPRSTYVRYLDSAAGYMVWGTGSGSRRDPDWFRNLRAATEATCTSDPGTFGLGLPNWLATSATQCGMSAEAASISLDVVRADGWPPSEAR